MTKKRPLTPPTKKHIRYANLLAHAERHPKCAVTQRHLTHAKWADYR